MRARHELEDRTPGTGIDRVRSAQLTLQIIQKRESQRRAGSAGEMICHYLGFRQPADLGKEELSQTLTGKMKVKSKRTQGAEFLFFTHFSTRLGTTGS